MKNLVLYFNFWRCIIPALICVLDRSAYNIVKTDLRKISYSVPKAESMFGLCWALVYNLPFRAVYQYRIKHHKLLVEIIKVLFPNKRQVEITGNIGGGFVVYHGQCCVIHCKEAGQNFSVFQGVTVGRNPLHTKEGVDIPSFGNNVTIYTNSVIAGGIHIGDNVQISAGSIVLENIPDNCIVAGNPAKVIKSM